MNVLANNFSKSARRKWRKYGILHESRKIDFKKVLKLSHKDIVTITSSLKPATQQHLWEKLELYGSYKNNNS